MHHSLHFVGDFLCLHMVCGVGHDPVLNSQSDVTYIQFMNECFELYKFNMLEGSV